MSAVPNYTVSQKIYEDRQTITYRGYRSDEQQETIIKFLKAEYPSPTELALLKHEYEVTQNLPLAGVIQVDRLESYSSRLALILENFSGETLETYLANTALVIGEILVIFLKIAQILESIHNRDFVHQNLNPQTIWIDPVTKQIKFTGFSIAFQGCVQPNPHLPEQACLAYLSPEQSGRINCLVDYRSDFYSLGVIFYQLITQKLPFAATEQLELFHNHVAVEPLPPHRLNPKIPLTVSGLISKLLSKSAENRYQSASGLIFDLKKCLSQWQDGEIINFPLAQKDISSQLRISPKLYGREQEISQLVDVFERVKQGKAELSLISGFSGVGKTTLVKAFQNLLDPKCYFVSGKFTTLTKDIPYYAIIQSFQELVQQLLSENEAKLLIWKQKIRAVLGNNAQIIIDVIPEIELIIGKQAPVPQLSAQEAEFRFHQVFLQFISVFTQTKHTFVIFLDDLQWADPASLKLLKLLFNQTNSKYLLVIGTYRSETVDSTHLLSITIEQITNAGARVNYIFLRSLNLNDLSNLLADSFNCQLSKVGSLAKVILTKTKGNSFFVVQFLKSIYQQDLLYFDRDKLTWQWQIEKIEKLDLTKNVVDFLKNQIKTLPVKARDVLTNAACFGGCFNINILAATTGNTLAETKDVLAKAIQENLIVANYEYQNKFVSNTQIDNLSCCFVHDQIQQAAYSLLSDPTKQNLHLKIGRLLLKDKQSNREENTFKIVNHLNIGRDLIQSKTEQMYLIQLNLIAAKKAKTSVAYQNALKYLKIGIGLLEKDSWNTHYNLTFSLNIERSECEYLLGNFEKAKQVIIPLLLLSRSQEEKARVYNLLINLYTDQGKPQQAINTGIKALTDLGLVIEITRLEPAIAQEISLINEAIGEQQIANLSALPPMSNSQAAMAMKIMLNLAASTYFANLNLWSLLMLKMVNLSLEYGNTQESFFAYCAYGLLIGSAFGDYNTGYQFGKLALAIEQKYETSNLTGKIYFMFGAFVNHWQNHVQTDWLYLKQAFERGNQTGDPSFSTYAANVLVAEKYLSGEPLSQVYQQVNFYLKYVNKVKNVHGIYFQTILKQTILTWQNQTKKAPSLNNGSFLEASYLKEMQSRNITVPLHFYYVVKLQLCFLFEDYTQALRMAGSSYETLYYSFGLLRVVEHYFYETLTRLAVYPKSQQPEHDWQIIETNAAKLKAWADNCPDNFLHKYLLIAAEMARVAKKDLEAMELYDRAIACAQENGYNQNEALANELAAKFYLARGKQKIARVYLLDACYGYRQWEATAKVAQLQQKYAQLLGFEFNYNETSRASTGLSLDLATVIKASQALSEQIVLDKLLAKLMKILIENAGAQTGYLIGRSPLKSPSEHWVIEAASSVDTEEITCFESMPVETMVSTAIVNYVARTHKNVVLDHAALEGQFTHDSYILTHQPKSILCTPLLHQGKLSGILYLENNLTTGAFTPERVEILKILSAQAAISIENSRLYERLEDYSRNLQQKVETRTQELKIKNQQLKSTLKKLKATQEQIIAQEKLASLGALTAGIAHEIKNPLNFVNNFAELSAEITAELLEELETQKDRIEPQSRKYIEELLQDLCQNSGKIQEHGKRADKIVRAMLMHSRGETGQRQKSDLNALLAESFTLAYHGMRAQDSTFEIKLKTNYDQTLKPVSVVPQEINRVFLNVINNACYALQQKKQAQGKQFEPILSLTTLNLEQKVEIYISDNGNGIAPETLDKIFHPFFTTKPTGEGTGLGLSISYDIIVGKHGGEIKVETEPGSTKFVIVLSKDSLNNKTQL